MKNRYIIFFGLLLMSLAVGNSIFSIDGVDQKLIGFYYSFIQTRASTEANISTIHVNEDNQDLIIKINEDLINKTATPHPKEFEIVEPAFNEQGFLPLRVEKPEAIVVTEQRKLPVEPIRLIIGTIDLDAPIVKAKQEEIVLKSGTFDQWSAPDEFAVGWQFDSAILGIKGNTVLNGHHNVHGKVFENLNKLVSGDRILVEGNDGNLYHYIVTNVMILPERDVKIEQRLENARWILPSADERITLITCWPYFSNTHRLIVVARPEHNIPREPIQ